jgi:hypothetical protein
MLLHNLLQFDFTTLGRIILFFLYDPFQFCVPIKPSIMKQYVVIFFAFSTFLTACSKKDNTPAPPPTASKPMLHQIAVEGSAEEKTTYQYYDDETFKEVRFRDVKQTYSYNTNTIEIKKYYDGIVAPVATYFGQRNAKGALTYLNGVETSGGSTESHSYTLSYDDKNQLTKIVFVRKLGNNTTMTYTYHYTWENGNRVKTEFLQDGQLKYTVHYTYAAFANQLPLNYFEFMSEGDDKLLGAVNKNLVATIQRKGPSGHVVSDVNFTWTLNTLGYPVKRQTVQTGWGSYNILYTYK